MYPHTIAEIPMLITTSWENIHELFKARSCLENLLQKLCQIGIVLLTLILCLPLQGFAAWHTLQTPHFILHYQPVDEHIARVLAEQAASIYDGVTGDLGYAPRGTVYVYLCPDPECFRQQQPSSVKLPKWAVGVAYPTLSRIVMRSVLAPDEHGTIRPVETFKHEFAHIALEQALEEQGGAPRWLSEGFSMYEAGQWTLHGQRTLEEVTLRDAFIPLTRLTTAFPVDEEQARIAYTQSYSLVSFMFRQYGKYDFQEFIANLRDGLDTDTALLYATGRSLNSLEQEWQDSLKRQPFWFTYFWHSGTFWFLISLIFLLAYLIKSWKARQIKKQWEQEETEEI